MSPLLAFLIIFVLLLIALIKFKVTPRWACSLRPSSSA